jgi:hypothetical protein
MLKCLLNESDFKFDLKSHLIKIINLIQYILFIFRIIFVKDFNSFIHFLPE